MSVSRQTVALPPGGASLLDRPHLRKAHRVPKAKGPGSAWDGCAPAIRCLGQYLAGRRGLRFRAEAGALASAAPRGLAGPLLLAGALAWHVFFDRRGLPD